MNTILSSFVLGGLFAVAVYGYVLIDYFPPTSLRILLFTSLAGLIGAVGYFILLKWWMYPQVKKLSKADKQKSILWGMLIGLFLMFAGTNAWTSSTRYITFLLPTHTLEIIADRDTQEASVLWISTSRGDVSFDALRLKGWERSGDRIILKDAADNFIRWQGRTGESAFILFEKSLQGGNVTVSWNGEIEIINLHNESAGELHYKRALQVPLYASFMSVMLVVSMNFMFAGLALYLLFLRNKMTVDETIEETAKGLSESSQSKAPNDVIVAVCLLLLTLLLRAFNLDNLYPYADEYTHLIAANNILRGVPLNEVYERGLFIVTLPAVASYSVFGASLWAARLPGVIFNVLGIIPLYLIARKINRQVALISCILFATSPYVIAYARNIREYAAYPFYFYWAAYFMILFLQDIPQNFILIKDWKKIKPSLLALALPLALVIPYVLFVDRLSTFKMILLMYGLFALFLLLKLDLRNASNWFVIGPATIAVSAGMSGILGKFLDLPTPEFRSLSFFFSNPEQQWYFDRLAIIPTALFLLGLYFAFRLRRVNFIPAFLVALFAGYMAFFIFLFRATEFNIHPRFVLAAQLWFIPILAMGLYTLWQFLRTWFKDRIIQARLAALILFLFSFNIGQSILPSVFDAEYMPVTELVHDDMSAADAYIMEHARADDVLVGSLYSSFVKWQGRPAFSDIYLYSNAVLDDKNTDGFSYVSSIIEQHPSGWIVIDDLRMGFVPPSLSLKETVIHGKNVEYAGKFLSQHIWHWSVK